MSKVIRQEEATKQPATAGKKGGWVTLPALLIGGVVAILLLAILLWPRAAPPPPPQPTVQAIAIVPTVPVPTATPVPSPTRELPTATPSCTSATPYIDIVVVHEQAGRWEQAVTTAEGALAIPTLCQSDRKALTQHAISSGFQSLYTQIFAPLDTEGHQRMIDSYLELKKRARDAAVTIDTPLQTAAKAFAGSQFQLARVALEEAYREGTFNPDIDRDITKLYVSTLYGLGKWYTTAPASSPLYSEGMRWLKTSQLVSEKYRIGDGEPAIKISMLGGKSVQPQPTPLLP